MIPLIRTGAPVSRRANQSQTGARGSGGPGGGLGGRMPGDRMPGAGRAGRAGGPRGCARQVNVFPLVSTPVRGVTWY